MCSRPPQLAPDQRNILTDVPEGLRPLVGTWRGKGRGYYPTIKNFEYDEELTFTHTGKPFLVMVQKTYNPSTKVPMHTETGYLHLVNHGKLLTLTTADPTGMTCVYEGRIAHNDGRTEFVLESTAVNKTSWAKEVKAVERQMTVSGDEMTYTLGMAAMGLAMKPHLEATLRRARPLALTAEFIRENGMKCTFVDVREPSELAKLPPVEGSITVPLGQLFAELGDPASSVRLALHRASGETTLIAVCASGKRAEVAARRLREAGWPETYVLMGGRKSWQ